MLGYALGYVAGYIVQSTNLVCWRICLSAHLSKQVHRRIVKKVDQYIESTTMGYAHNDSLDIGFRCPFKQCFEGYDC